MKRAVIFQQRLFKELTKHYYYFGITTVSIA